MGVEQIPGMSRGCISRTAGKGSLPGENRETAFGEVLRKRAEGGLVFSQHAKKRMNERGIQADSSMISRMERAVESARQKGAREIALIGNRDVFIVNIPNRTVVTTMSREDLKNRIITNVDSAVFM